MTPMDLLFAGAAGTVTGSRTLLADPAARVLVDCGLFQGWKQLRLRNRAPFPVPPRSIDTVLLTHAHLDHSGWLPVLVRDGFRGRVLCTPPTRDLLGLLLRDSAHLQEEEARFANRHGFSKHHPAEPLYTLRDAERALERLDAVPFDVPVSLPAGLQARFVRAGHLLGAASVAISRGDATLLMSGDIGRPQDPVMKPPAPPPRADWIVVESTYGDRTHPSDDFEAQLARIVCDTAAAGGTVLIPSFAVGRAQAVLLALWRLKQAHRIPDLPVYLDSPMAIDATALYRRHRHHHRLDPEACAGLGRVARLARTPDESRAIGDSSMPAVILAASGMATGGRVLHHLKRLAPDPRNHLLFVGFQAGGTRGAHLVAGAREVKVHGAWVPVRAGVSSIDSLSAHADADELIGWLRGARRAPRQVFVNHGEPEAADRLRQRIGETFGWPVTVPAHGERYPIDL